MESKKTRLYLGDHLKVSRLGFSHHGVYVGGGVVIANTRDGVAEYSLDDFAQGSKICVISEKKNFSRQDIVLRARQRIGEKNYNVITNNCEHFVLWCTQGHSKSVQVKNATLATVSVAACSVALAVKHRAYIEQGLKLAVNSAAAHPAGAALKAVIAGLKIIDTAQSINVGFNILKKDLSSLEKTLAVAGIIGGLSENDAEKIATQIAKLGKRGASGARILKDGATKHIKSGITPVRVKLESGGKYLGGLVNRLKRKTHPLAEPAEDTP